MKIRKSTEQDLVRMMEIYAHAREFMVRNGNPNQWGTSKPARETIEEDIKLGRSYVCVEDEKIAATFFYLPGVDPTYVKIYDGEKQGTGAGGSGCGCSAVTLSGHYLKELQRGRMKRILFVPTGALLSTVSFNEGQTVPGIAHGVVLEHVEG